MRGAIQLRPAFRRVLQAGCPFSMLRFTLPDEVSKHHEDPSSTMHGSNVTGRSSNSAEPRIVWFWYVPHILQHMVLIQGYARRSIIETCSPQRRPPMIWSSFLKTSRCALCYCTEIFGTEILQEQSNRSPAITSFRFAFKHPCRLTGM